MPCQVRSVSAPIRVVPCQAPSVSVRAVPCPVRSLRVSVSVSCRRHPAKLRQGMPVLATSPEHDHSRPGGQPVRSRTSKPLSRPNLQKTSLCFGSEVVQDRFATFSLKKNACGKMDGSNRACQILGGHFRRKKSACGKMDSSNRACQILGCHFHRKKATAASWLAATGLVKVQIMAA